MFTVKNYVVAKTLDEAYTLLQKNRQNRILGGTMWMRMGNKAIDTAIDLSALGLDQIIETDEMIEIGAMCTLRQVETSDVLKNYCDGILSQSVAQIVGVQFRNSATVGGSVYSRFGFSDLLTALLGLDTYVELYHGGQVDLKTFMDMPYTKDIITKMRIYKEKGRGVYLTERLSATDLPLLTVCATRTSLGYRVVIGARPSRARLAEVNIGPCTTDEQYEEIATQAVQSLTFGSNMRGTETYRKRIAVVLVKRALKAVEV